MPRRLAYDVLLRVEKESAYSHIALDAELKRRALSPQDRGLATEIVYGTLMWASALDKVLGRFIKGGVRRAHIDVLILLRTAAYQWLFLDRVPEHAILNESVEVIKHTKQARAAGFVNGVLRAMIREDKASVKWWDDEDRARKPVRYIGQRWALPSWIANRLTQGVPIERAEAMARALTQRPDLILRHIQGAEPLDSAHKLAPFEDIYRYERWNDEVRRAIDAGAAVVQDLGSQLVARALGAGGGARVLDACAGLGSKGLHIAGMLDEQGRVDLVDPQAKKLKRAQAMASSIGVDSKITTHPGSLARFAQTSPVPYDAVLVDAPCSGLGVIRRHPETKWRRAPSDITDLAAVQARILDEAAELVAPGGAMVYSVCTFTPEEGPRQVAAFLERHADFSPDPLPEGTPWETFGARGHELALNPLDHGADHFYMARLRRAE